MCDGKVGTARRRKMTVMPNRALKTWSLSANWLFGLIFPDQSSLMKVDGGWVRKSTWRAFLVTRCSHASVSRSDEVQARMEQQAAREMYQDVYVDKNNTHLVASAWASRFAHGVCTRGAFERGADIEVFGLPLWNNCSQARLDEADEDCEGDESDNSVSSLACGLDQQHGLREYCS